MTTATMAGTHPDNSALLDAAEEFFAALERGAPHEELRAIMRQVPISPAKALSFKKLYGKEFLTREFNLSEADAALGAGWLDA